MVAHSSHGEQPEAMAAARPSTSGVCDVRLIGCCCGSERYAIAATVVWSIRFPTHTDAAHTSGDDNAASHDEHDEPNASGLERIVIVRRRWRNIVARQVTRREVPSVTCCGRTTRQAPNIAAFAAEAVPATRIDSMTRTRSTVLAHAAHSPTTRAGGVRAVTATDVIGAWHVVRAVTTLLGPAWDAGAVTPPAVAQGYVIEPPTMAARNHTRGGNVPTRGIPNARTLGSVAGSMCMSNGALTAGSVLPTAPTYTSHNATAPHNAESPAGTLKPLPEHVSVAGLQAFSSTQYLRKVLMRDEPTIRAQAPVAVTPRTRKNMTTPHILRSLRGHCKSFGPHSCAGTPWVRSFLRRGTTCTVQHDGAHRP